MTSFLDDHDMLGDLPPLSSSWMERSADDAGWSHPKDGFMRDNANEQNLQQVVDNIERQPRGIMCSSCLDDDSSIVFNDDELLSHAIAQQTVQLPMQLKLDGKGNVGVCKNVAFCDQGQWKSGCVGGVGEIRGSNDTRYKYECGSCHEWWDQIRPDKLMPNQDPCIRLLQAPSQDKNKRSSGYRCGKCSLKKDPQMAAAAGETDWCGCPKSAKTKKPKVPWSLHCAKAAMQHYPDIPYPTHLADPPTLPIPSVAENPLLPDIPMPAVASEVTAAKQAVCDAFKISRVQPMRGGGPPVIAHVVAAPKPSDAAPKPSDAVAGAAAVETAAIADEVVEEDAKAADEVVEEDAKAADKEMVEDDEEADDEETVGEEAVEADTQDGAEEAVSAAIEADAASAKRVSFNLPDGHVPYRKKTARAGKDAKRPHIRIIDSFMTPDASMRMANASEKTSRGKATVSDLNGSSKPAAKMSADTESLKRTASVAATSDGSSLKRKTTADLDPDVDDESYCFNCKILLDGSDVWQPSIGCSRRKCPNWACFKCAGFKTRSAIAKHKGAWYCGCKKHRVQ